LRETAAKLAAAVDGIDWSAQDVGACCRRLADEATVASQEQLAEALAVLVARLARARIEDADGVAHVAISAGTLVEKGAPAQPLSDVLLGHLPGVLVAARRFADGCLAAMGEPKSEEADDAEEADAIAYVDDRAIPRAVFREHLASDRGGGASLAYLEQWILPAVAALTRQRESLIRATKDAELCRAAKALARSNASWLHTLTGVQLEAPWLVVFPALERGFRLTVDGVATNFDLHALIADALIERGVPGTRNPRDVMGVIRGTADSCVQNHVAGSWNLYTFRAAAYDVRAAEKVPTEHWVWGEGQPRDVPVVDDMRTLVIGPPKYSRVWDSGRTFCALHPSVEVVSELSTPDVRATLRRLSAAG
jgi:hypothetical protein